MAAAPPNHQAGSPRRDRADRLTVDLPSGTLTALKVHAAQREMTIREIVVALLRTTLNGKNS
ncbi:hypothetical protein GGE43_004751 [Agrobacterium tumefaciens]|uniref:Ribbon-helix-helix protein CopG domain-containing protein n=1 Tax=Agrobacterium radiobacter TaxID=362 RepID=A0ABR6J6P0_AGRRD|nr:hypothetical protein [Agrobacterium radiobacter]TGE76533.1 hypothetical protein C9410_23180 [Rhizobium sp. SEMIA 439]MBB4283902.1 hypothetical protein [Agrobacterium radiobacter]MBB4319601.1 hypothetical protein [Agrobacterium radiobacter]MBB4325989.1 hypothetical protein [Agrobacterium radiobacter]MBB4337867.1 hypothetical protein [Agrobacterium radiobacter]